MSKPALDTYKAKRKSYHIYRAAATLWSEGGVEWSRALEVITAAFDAATHE